VSLAVWMVSENGLGNSNLVIIKSIPSRLVASWHDGSSFYMPHNN